MLELQNIDKIATFILTQKCIFTKTKHFYNNMFVES